MSKEPALKYDRIKGIFESRMFEILKFLPLQVHMESFSSQNLNLSVLSKFYATLKET